MRIGKKPLRIYVWLSLLVSIAFPTLLLASIFRTIRRGGGAAGDRDLCNYIKGETGNFAMDAGYSCDIQFEYIAIVFGSMAIGLAALLLAPIPIIGFVRRIGVKRRADS